jgi:hypothetical protein
VRVVMSDAIKQFAASLLQARPVLKSQQVFDLADRIVSPRPPDSAQDMQAFGQEPASREPAGYESASAEQGFNPSDLSFAFDEGQAAAQPEAAAPALRPGPKKNRVMGMTPGQLAILALMGLVECCVLAAAAYLLFIVQ